MEAGLVRRSCFMSSLDRERSLLADAGSSSSSKYTTGGWELLLLLADLGLLLVPLRDCDCECECDSKGRRSLVDISP